MINSSPPRNSGTKVSGGVDPLEYCQVDAEWTKLARTKPSGRPELLDEGNTNRIAPSGEGMIAGSSVFNCREAMAAELEVVVDWGMSSEELLGLPD